MKRLFLALSVEKTARHSLHDTYKYLKKFYLILKLVNEKNYHITIKFLGVSDNDKFSLNRIVLFESKLTPKGPEYTEINSIGLD